MKKTVVAAAGFALALAWASPSAAAPISFDVNGLGAGGLITDATVFDFNPGNSIIMERGGGLVTILFQANLGTIVTTGHADDYTNGTAGPGSFFTATAAFNATLTSPSTYTITPGGAFYIYADNERGSDLAGTGFALDAGAIPILTGTALNGSGSLVPTAGEVAGTVNNNPLGCTPTAGVLVNCLDQQDGNDYPNFYTMNGSGGTNVTVSVTGFDANYFKNLVIGTSLAFVSTQNNLPFRQADPSAAFSSNGVADANSPGVASVCGPGQLGTAASPCVNGTGNNIMAETDASTSFVGTQAVPEPASLTLLGVGLLGSAAARRRQRKAKQNIAA